jgi:hypothetical protein
MDWKNLLFCLLFVQQILYLLRRQCVLDYLRPIALPDIIELLELIKTSHQYKFLSRILIFLIMFKRLNVKSDHICSRFCDHKGAFVWPCCALPPLAPMLFQLIFYFCMCYIVARRRCGTRSHMLWYDGYEIAYIIRRRRNNKDTAACEMYDSLYKQMVFTIL